MRYFIHFIVMLAACTLIGCSSSSTRLFNGKDLTGWTPCLADESATPQQVWTVPQPGILHCQGKPNGFIRTNNRYQNYQLHLEWRWTDTPANSGVLLHANGPDQVWPQCIEAQLKNQSAGDFVLIQHGAAITVDGTRYEPTTDIFKAVPKQQPASERQPGQWNSYDIICLNDTITVYVNGILQNFGTDASLTRGAICLQSEGGPIEFRNITLKPID